MSNPDPQRVARLLLRCGRAALVALALTAVLAGCASTIADHLPSQAGGLPANAPERSIEPAAYPAVHDMPPPRDTTVLSDDQVKKAEDELIAARNRQERQVGQPSDKKASP
jgi:hypothetical protein